MVPLVSLSRVSGVSLKELVAQGRLCPDRLASILQRTKKGGGEIVDLLKTTSAFYAPAAAAVLMAEAHLRDKKWVLPCSSRLTRGQYGVTEPLFMGVPVKIGVGGIEEILEVALDEQEQKGLQRSIEAIRELNRAVDGLGLFQVK